MQTITRRTMLLSSTVGLINFPFPQLRASAPVITSLSSELFKDMQAGIVISGFGFGATQGVGKIELEVQGRNQPDPSIGQSQDWIKATQTVTSWADTQIIFNCLLPSYLSAKWPHHYKLKVTTDGGHEVIYQNLVLVGPDQSTVGRQNAAGLVEIRPTDTPQAVVDREAAGTAYLIKAGTHVEWMVSPKASDVYLAESGAILRGGVEVRGWTKDGASWKAVGQTQADRFPSKNRVDTDASSDSWDSDNDGQADFFIGLSTQSGPYHRVRRGNSKDAIEAAPIATDLLPNNPITTVAGSRFVTIADPKAGPSAGVGGGITFGEVIRITGASEVGGITIEDGFYCVLDWDDGVSYVIEGPRVATASATGGGASITRTKGWQVYFDSANDTVYVNQDPTVSNLEVRNSTARWAFKGRDGVDNVHIRGKSDKERLEIKEYATVRTDNGAICGVDYPGVSDAWRLQYLNIHHIHGFGFGAGGQNHGWEVWDVRTSYNGQKGHAGRGGFMRRIESYCNNTAHNRQNNGAGGCKIAISHANNVDFDQGTYYKNFGNGFWLDIDNGTTEDGIRRIDSWENSGRGFYLEVNGRPPYNPPVAGRINLSNCLSRGNLWYNRNGNYSFRTRPAAIQINTCQGSSTHPVVVENCRVEVPDGFRAGGNLNNPTNGIVIQADSRRGNAQYNFFRKCIVIYLGNTNGVPQSGFFQSNNKNGQEDIDLCQNTSDFIRNSYYYTGAETDPIFGFMSGLNAVTDETKTAWIAGHKVKYDDDSNFTFNVAADDLPLSTWPKGKMPNWTKIGSQ